MELKTQIQQRLQAFSGTVPGTTYLATHQLYKRPLMIKRDSTGRFMTIRQNANGKNVEDQVFRLELMIG